MPQRSTSTSLLSRLRDVGDHVAWQEFDARYRKLLLRYCWRRGMSHTDAEDIVQLVFAGIARSLPQFMYDPERGRFRDYLFCCVRNAILQWQRRPERRHRPLDSAIDESLAHDWATARPDTAERQAWQAEWVAHHYRMALAAVARTFDRRSVELFERLVAGARPVALAQELGVSEDAIYKVRQRVRDRMRALIAQQVLEEDTV